MLLPFGATQDALSLRRYQLHSQYLLDLDKAPEQEEFKRLIQKREQDFIDKNRHIMNDPDEFNLNPISEAQIDSINSST